MALCGELYLESPAIMTLHFVLSKDEIFGVNSLKNCLYIIFTEISWMSVNIKNYII